MFHNLIENRTGCGKRGQKIKTGWLRKRVVRRWGLTLGERGEFTEPMWRQHRLRQSLITFTCLLMGHLVLKIKPSIWTYNTLKSNANYCILLGSWEKKTKDLEWEKKCAGSICWLFAYVLLWTCFICFLSHVMVHVL